LRESAPAKARRYLTDGRVVIRRITPRTVMAQVRGDGEMYTVTGDPAGWSCTCPARGRCCHQLAVGLVVDLSPALVAA